MRVVLHIFLCLALLLGAVFHAPQEAEAALFVAAPAVLAGALVIAAASVVAFSNASHENDIVPISLATGLTSREIMLGTILINAGGFGQATYAAGASVAQHFKSLGGTAWETFQATMTNVVSVGDTSYLGLTALWQYLGYYVWDVGGGGSTTVGLVNASGTPISLSSGLVGRGLTLPPTMPWGNTPDARAALLYQLAFAAAAASDATAKPYFFGPGPSEQYYLAGIRNSSGAVIWSASGSHNYGGVYFQPGYRLGGDGWYLRHVADSVVASQIEAGIAALNGAVPGKPAHLQPGSHTTTFPDDYPTRPPSIALPGVPPSALTVPGALDAPAFPWPTAVPDFEVKIPPLVLGLNNTLADQIRNFADTITVPNIGGSVAGWDWLINLLKALWAALLAPFVWILRALASLVESLMAVAGWAVSFWQLFEFHLFRLFVPTSAALQGAFASILDLMAQSPLGDVFALVSDMVEKRMGGGQKLALVVSFPYGAGRSVTIDLRDGLEYVQPWRWVTVGLVYAWLLHAVYRLLRPRVSI